MPKSLLRSRPSLRNSIIIGMLLVITLVSIGFTYAVRAAFDQLEYELLDQRLMAELAEFKRMVRSIVKETPPWPSPSSTMSLELGQRR